mgnify:CR=1 FL=1
MTLPENPFPEEAKIEDYIECIFSTYSDKEVALMNIEEEFRTDLWNTLTPFKGVVTKEYFLKVADEVFTNLELDEDWEWVSKEAVLK